MKFNAIIPAYRHSIFYLLITVIGNTITIIIINVIISIITIIDKKRTNGLKSIKFFIGYFLAKLFFEDFIELRTLIQKKNSY